MKENLFKATARKQGSEKTKEMHKYYFATETSKSQKKWMHAMRLATQNVVAPRLQLKIAEEVKSVAENRSERLEDTEIAKNNVSMSDSKISRKSKILC